MLAEDDRGRRQLRDLMARGFRNRLALRRAEHMAAATATGPVVDELVERLYRCQMTTASRMARLGAAPAPRGSSLPALRRGRRILAGGQRGVARVAVQAPLKLGDALLLLGEALAQLGDLTPEQSVLRRELQEHSDDRFTSLLIDRLSLGAFHAQGLRGARVRACLCPPAVSSSAPLGRPTERLRDHPRLQEFRLWEGPHPGERANYCGPCRASCARSAHESAGESGACGIPGSSPAAAW